MISEKLFSRAIGLVPPRLEDHVTFMMEEKCLDLHINFPKGSRLACPVCGEATQTMIPVTTLGGTWTSSGIKRISMPAYPSEVPRVQRGADRRCSSTTFLPRVENIYPCGAKIRDIACNDCHAML